MDRTDDAERFTITHLPNNLSGARAWSIVIPVDGPPVAEPIALSGFMVRTHYDELGFELERHVEPIVFPEWDSVVVQSTRDGRVWEAQQLNAVCHAGGGHESHRQSASGCTGACTVSSTSIRCSREALFLLSWKVAAFADAFAPLSSATAEPWFGIPLLPSQRLLSFSGEADRDGIASW